MKIKIFVAILGFVTLCQTAFSQTFTANDYRKCIWMTTRFYGAQRSGDNNWTVHNHLPAGVNAALTGRCFRADGVAGRDLSGGWHDCGDHVKFGQTQFYSAYILLKGYAEFKQGYDDFYSYAYNGYKAAGNWTYEGSGHDPNCIPDVLDEMKHATDYFLKVIPNATNFYYQVGRGGCPGDHCRWETAVRMQTNNVGNGGNNDTGVGSGPLREVYSNPADASMASFCGATLALMSRMYRQFDAAYADLCLQHAIHAYTYAKANPGTVGSAGGGQYPANSDWRDDLATLCAELYWATGNNAYRTEAIALEPNVNFNAGWSFDYSNNGEIALYNLAKLGNASALTRFNNRITGHFLAAGSRNGAGVYTAYGNWGRLRYNGNAAFLIALYSKLNNNTTAGVLNAIYNDVDYIMGKNTPKRSYIVGFEPAAGGPYITPQYPHHRNAFLRDDNPGNAIVLTIPAKNRQLGALVGGQRDGTYNDDRNDYVNSEVCIDYNAGLVGALGFINSRVAPVDTMKFCGMAVCRKPALGPDLSTCSGTTLPVLLDANTGNAGGAISYQWYTWNGSTSSVIGGATARTYSAPAVGGYIVKRDSTAGGVTCTRYDTVFISNTLAKPLIGPSTTTLNLCNPASVNLTVSNAGSMPSGVAYQWQRANVVGGPYTNIVDETGSTLANVRTVGFYRIHASLGACVNSDTMRITSNLPTPVDGCVGSGPIPLSIANPGLGTGPYNWFNVPTGGTSLGTGTSYNAPSAGTYYVQDMSAVNAIVGPYFPAQPTTYGGGGNSNADNQVQTVFTAVGNFTISNVYVPYMLYGAGEVGKRATVEVIDDATLEVVGVSEHVTGVLASGTYSAQGVYIIRLPINLAVVGGTAGTPRTLRIRFRNGAGNDGNTFLFNDNTDPFDGTMPLNYPYLDSQGGNIMRIVRHNVYNNNTTTRYGFFVGFQISAGLSCARLPVIASNTNCSGLPVDFVYFKAEAKDYAVDLSWGTESEINQDYYEVQRSADGSEFVGIGKVQGAGLGGNFINYTYKDQFPLNQLNYYRIASFDLDGSVQYSKVVTAYLGKFPIQVLPNPSDGIFNVYLSGADITKVTVSSMLGVTVLEDAPGKESCELNLSGMSSGVYLLLIEYDGRRDLIRIVKN
ncbi:MAG: glycoside hydrolase family 9 protein [Cytophagaceae bacterium]